MLTYRQTVEQRLLSKLEENPDTGCWEWQPPVSGKGRPMMSVAIARPSGKSTLRYACRVAAWIWLGVELDGDHKVCHDCDNKLCCNPDHLFTGTQADNVHDSMAKGRFHKARGEQHGNAKFTEEQVMSIRRDHAGGLTRKQIVQKYGISESHVGQLVRRKNWKHLTKEATWPSR